MPPGFHPLLARWFADRFGEPTEPQALAWPEIAAGRDVLVSAPTGSGKTLAAFLSAIDALWREALEGRLGDGTRVVYVSPLRALSNDIEKNLTAPLGELAALARAEGLPPPDLRVAVRTGDTPAARRATLLRRPPHVLVTTPESLYLLLTSERGRGTLGGVETVIVDEIHAVAASKRGAHLALSLERLEALCRRRPQRIGLSATQAPLEELGRFLVGTERVDRQGRPRCAIVEVGRRRPLDLAIEVPRDELSSVASTELWGETYDRVAELVRAHRTTLVFVGTRRLAERAAQALGERLGPGQVAAHHGSLSRLRRLAVEERLKRGDLPAVVATASLELGLDVGEVELAVQLGSPGSLSAALQRFGRAGHFRGGVPKGRLFPLSRDELAECAALVRGLRAGRLERTAVPPAPLDILCQQVVAEAASAPIHEERLLALVRRAWPYRDLTRQRFDEVIALLSEGIATGAGRSTALLHRDGVARRVKGRRGARLAALTGGGAIPDSSQYTVVAEPEGATVGQVDEDFAVESMAGDVFLLGTTSWRIRRVEPGVVRVEDAGGAPPGIPFWRGEAPGRSGALSAEVSSLREEVELRLPDRARAAAWLAAECALPEAGGRQLVDYLAASRAVLGALPTQATLVAERFFDEAGGMQLVLHAPFGARLNRALGLALRKRFCRTFDFELQAAATDDGILLSLGPQHAFPLETIFSLVRSDTLDETLTQAVLQAPMFQVRWRWNATRALAIPRLWKGKRTPPQLARMRAEDLLAAAFPAQVACQDNAPVGPIAVPDHPLVAETLRDCLHEAMDLDGVRELLLRMERGEVRLLAVDTAEPSPLSHEVLGAKPWAYLDDAPLEERRARMVAIRRALPPAEAVRLGALDPAAVEGVARQVWPAPRDEEELHEALLDLVLWPVSEPAPHPAWLGALERVGRARRVEVGARRWWCATEREEVARAAAAGGAEPLLPALRGWAPRVGPFTAATLAARLQLEAGPVEAALEALEGEGLVLRGHFLAEEPPGGGPHWCERSVLARIHRLTLAGLRREIEPATAADLLRFLARWQHVAPGAQLHGVRGLAEVVGQLQGFHAAAGAWERHLLPARVAGYQARWLDELCLGGEVVFGRLAPSGDPAAPRRRAAPTRNGPVTLALREDLPWLCAAQAGPAPALGPSARDLVAVLSARGASFVSELTRATGRLAWEIEAALWELVSAGVVTCDAFAGLRTLIDPPDRRVPRRAAFAGGRWSLLGGGPAAGPPADEALERVAWLYLRRYGVVLRDLLVREAAAPPWRELLRLYRTLEARGSVRGGRFVAGFSGEQFALPEAVEALRAVRRAPRQGEERVVVSASDPLNLIGILTPGARVAAGPAGRVRFVDGVPAAEGSTSVGAGAVTAGRSAQLS